MSDSNKLRKTHNRQNFILNKKSKKQQNPVKEATYRIKDILQKEYSNIEFSIKKSIEKKYVGHCINKQKGGKSGKFISNESSFISPDGNFLIAKINKIERIILSSEAKVQGTNDARKIEGKKKQAKGNACERAVKNYNEIRQLFIGEKIFPYSIFFSGCDFEKGSSIIDRITSMNDMRPLNKIYVHYKGCASLFVREKRWELKQIFAINLKIAKEALLYWLKEIERKNKNEKNGNATE